MVNLALENVIVVNFGWVLAAPMTGKYLADLGARVIRVESIHRPDPLRTSTPYKDNIPGINRSAYHALYNANNYSMALNLKHPKGVELAKRLVEKSDVVIENFTPGAMERLGLSYKDLKEVKNDIIMISMSMQGQTGPYAGYLGFGNQLTGLAGFTQITGWPDRDPVQPYAGVTDACTPSLGAAAVISAMLYRLRTGKGQYLDLSQNEASIHYLAPLMLDYFSSGRIAGRSGNRCAYAAPHAVYPCRGEDQWCAIAVFSDEEWRSFCRVLGDPEWTVMEKFSSFSGRKSNEDELDSQIASWTRKHSADEVTRLMQSAGIAAGVVNSSEQLLADPQLKHRNFFWYMNHGELGEYPHIGEAFQLSETPVEGRMAAPALGEHTEYVCREIMGMPDVEFIELMEDGVFE
ncbi:MAG: CoA transferase [Deltaproteobacteria bacterium]|nr:CoA transferase [Deltaproteobacteria bacterium]